MVPGIVLKGCAAGLVCSLALIVGCGGGGGGGGGPDAAALTAEGWTHYERGEYTQAIGRFDAAVSADPTYADAYNGLGWSYGKLDSLARALANFALAISNGATSAEPYAGEAPVYRDLDPPQFQNAITAATAALARDASFAFAHHQSFDWQDLHVIMAQCYFELQDYTHALVEVTILDPTNTLDPDSDGFVSDLAGAIEDLQQDFGE